MLDKLIESKNNKQESKILKGLLFGTSSIAVCGVITALIFSLFSQNLAMGSNAIELSSLVAPTIIPENKPEPPEPPAKSKKITKQNVKTDIPTRKHNILRLDESPAKVPQNISTSPSNAKARPTTNFRVGSEDLDPPQVESYNVKASSDSNSKGVGDGFDVGVKPENVKTEKPEIKKTIPKPPPLPPKPPKPETKKPNKTVVSKGIINGTAKRLVKPGYSAAAKAANIRGQVTVKVLIDENGNVMSAKVVKGHPLLRQGVANAARKSTFSPTFLSDQRVKVSGLIIYNFN